MSTPNSVIESWVPEPELRDMPPRRVAPSDFPDLNKPNGTLFMGAGGASLALGFVLLFMGLAAGKGALFIILGIVLALAGAGLIAYFPTRLNSHKARAEHLVTNGVPVMARILSSENLTGDSQFGRSVKYQIALPGGEMVHRDVNADERILPKRVPGDVTALMDMNTGDCELYCVLPFRAVPKGEPVSRPATTVHRSDPAPTTPVVPVAAATAEAPPAPTGVMGNMGSMENVVRPVRPVKEPEPEPVSIEPEPAAPKSDTPKPQTGASGLPWE